MQEWLPNLGLTVAAFLIGGVPFGYLIGRANGIDIREHGSGNIGATNVLRTLGPRWGGLCFICDALKGFLPVFAAARIAEHTQIAGSELTPVLAVFGTVSGHIWTPYLGFRGGKGVATSAGAVGAVAPLPIVVAFIVWFLVFQVSRYVSLGSICAAAALPLAAMLAPLATPLPAPPLPTVVLLWILAALTVYRHRSNISRLLKGTESKFTRKAVADAHCSGQ